MSSRQISVVLCDILTALSTCHGSLQYCFHGTCRGRAGRGQAEQQVTMRFSSALVRALVVLILGWYFKIWKCRCRSRQTSNALASLTTKRSLASQGRYHLIRMLQLTVKFAYCLEYEDFTACPVGPSDMSWLKLKLVGPHLATKKVEPFSSLMLVTYTSATCFLPGPLEPPSYRQLHDDQKCFPLMATCQACLLCEQQDSRWRCSS